MLQVDCSLPFFYLLNYTCYIYKFYTCSSNYVNFELVFLFGIPSSTQLMKIGFSSNETLSLSGSCFIALLFINVLKWTCRQNEKLDLSLSKLYVIIIILWQLFGALKKMSAFTVHSDSYLQSHATGILTFLQIDPGFLPIIFSHMLIKVMVWKPLKGSVSLFSFIVTLLML